jgi:hypothetical protein
LRSAPIFLANNLDHRVDVQERDQQAIQDMQPCRHLVEAVVEPPLHGVRAEFEPLLEQRLQPVHARSAIEANDI